MSKKSDKRICEKKNPKTLKRKRELEIKVNPEKKREIEG